MSWLNLIEDDSDILDLLYLNFVKAYPGLDKKGQASFSVQLLTYQLASILAQAVLSEKLQLNISVNDVQLSLNNKSGDQLQNGLPTLHLIEPSVNAQTMSIKPLAAHFYITITQFVEPLIDKQRIAMRLSVGAQWRLVADAIASACLAAGQLHSKSEQAILLFKMMQKINESKIANPHTSIIKLSQKIDRYFVSRGGCCRYYTAVGGDYCAGCIHRTMDNQIERINALLVG
ncbi:(2Fe-2S)-binding protein [Reinekea forsetii]|nr:(2Fe-2S)-binding protein [Reinekea forsetii]